jgi:hypothetical protein
MKQEFSCVSLKTLVFLAAFVALGGYANAFATEVHTWTDENGVVHFSDAPSQSGDSEKINIEEVYKPGSTGAYPATDSTAPAPGTSATQEGEDGLQSAAEERRQQIAETRKEKHEAQAEAERSCGRHRQRLTQMEPARRVFYTDEQGESVRMDDDQRMGLIEESKEYLADNCE